MREKRNEVIEQTAAYIKDRFNGECTGHDWWHIYRVWRTARQIGEAEGADLFIVELAALLHDIADWKFNNGCDHEGPRQARRWLESRNVPAADIDLVTEIIAHMSFRGANVPNGMSTLEGKVVQDADRLDAIGAIGIARTFAYGGFKGRPIHDPEWRPVLHDSYEAYKNNSGPTVAHFHEKLLLLRDRLNTGAARAIARSRHQFMETFLTRFSEEWDGRR